MFKMIIHFYFNQRCRDVEMQTQDLDNALDIIESLLEEELNEKKVSDLSQLQEILKCTKDHVDQSITFDSFAGAINDDDCSGYLQVRLRFFWLCKCTPLGVVQFNNRVSMNPRSYLQASCKEFRHFC